MCVLRRELKEARSESEKWEKLHDEDTDHLTSIQQRDNYGPTETLNEAATRLSRDLSEARRERDSALRCEQDQITLRKVNIANMEKYKEQRDRLVEAIRWALGEHADGFSERPENKGAYWWRSELRKRAALAAVEGGNL
jgi:hypothetical protein